MNIETNWNYIEKPSPQFKKLMRILLQKKGIDNGMFIAFNDNKREVTTKDIVFAISEFPPLYNTCIEDIAALREWAMGKDSQGGRARIANSADKPIKVNKSETVRKNKTSRLKSISLGNDDVV